MDDQLKPLLFIDRFSIVYTMFVQIKMGMGLRYDLANLYEFGVIYWLPLLAFLLLGSSHFNCPVKSFMGQYSRSSDLMGDKSLIF